MKKKNHSHRFGSDNRAQQSQNSDAEEVLASALDNADDGCTVENEADDAEMEDAKTSDESDKLAESEAKIAELQDKYLRQVAEFDNYRKRTMKEKAELILNGGERTLTAILPIIDDMERALQTIEKTDDIKAVKEGIELIYQKFIKTLESQGLKKIDTDGQDFNTDYHEAIALIPAQSDEQKGKILDCVQAGYTLNDKVIRHAKVAVGQ